MLYSKEREMAKQPLASPGAQEQAEPLEEEPENEPEEMSGDGLGPHWEAMESIDWDSGEPPSLMTYMILPERLAEPVTTDFTDFLRKLMAQLYDRFGKKCFHSSEVRTVVGEKTWKLMRLNIEKLVRRGMVERKRLSRFESEYRILTDPEERPDIFRPIEEESVRPSVSYAGGSSYAGPAVSYAAAGV